MDSLHVCPLCKRKVDVLRQHVYLTRGNFYVRYVYDNHLHGSTDEFCSMSGLVNKDVEYER